MFKPINIHYNWPLSHTPVDGDVLTQEDSTLISIRIFHCEYIILHLLQVHSLFWQLALYIIYTQQALVMSNRWPLTQVTLLWCIVILNDDAVISSIKSMGCFTRCLFQKIPSPTEFLVHPRPPSLLPFTDLTGLDAADDGWNRFYAQQPYWKEIGPPPYFLHWRYQ